MVDRFTSMLDCVDIGFLPDGTLDQLPLPAQVGATRTGGLDINLPRIRAALPPPPRWPPPRQGFTVAEFTAQVQAMTGQEATASARPPTTCASSAAKTSPSSPARPAATTSPPMPPAPSPRCSPSATRLSRPVLAGIRRPGSGPEPAHPSPVDDDYAALRAGMQALFGHLGISELPDAA